jgi:hypothetical protein
MKLLATILVLFVPIYPIDNIWLSIVSERSSMMFTAI